MPRLNRSEICAGGEAQMFLLINRCVHRKFLCGKHRLSGKDYSHRKEWIRERLEELAGIFGIDILGFEVMSDHFQVVIRTRPDSKGEPRKYPGQVCFEPGPPAVRRAGMAGFREQLPAAVP